MAVCCFLSPIQLGEFVEVSNGSKTDPCAWVGYVIEVKESGYLLSDLMRLPLALHACMGRKLHGMEAHAWARLPCGRAEHA